MPRILHEDGTFEVVKKVLTTPEIRQLNIDMINSSPIAEASKKALIDNLPCGEVFTSVADIPVPVKTKPVTPSV